MIFSYKVLWRNNVNNIINRAIGTSRIFRYIDVIVENIAKLYINVFHSKIRVYF